MELMLYGFSQALQPMNLFLMLVGTSLGIIFGAIPGLTATMAIALCLPFTFNIDLVPSFSLLLALYIGGISGGLISAILINIPGTPASVATTFDGFPMSEKGETGKALSTGIIFSFIGTVFGIFVLMFVAPPLGRYTVKFGVFEYFSVAVLSLTLVSALSGKSMVKGVIACLIGLFMSCVGAAPVDGFARYTFGIHAFDAGFHPVPALVGLFAFSEVMKAARRIDKFSVRSGSIKIKGVGFSMKEFVQQIPVAFRAALIGTGIGILPGIGAATCNILAYGAAKKASRHPEKFGTGIMDGIVASETSNNASIGGAMVPLVTLGIPGDAVTAVLLGALSMQGLQPGPLFFANNIKFIYTIFAILLLSSMITVVMQFFGVRGFVRLLKVPKGVLLPMVWVLCMVGAFGANNRIFDVWTLLIFGLLGYLMLDFEFPLTPIIMGYVLGPIVEIYLRRGLMMSRGSIAPFFTRPISGVFLVLTIVIVVFQIVRAFRNTQKRRAGMAQTNT